MGNWKKVGTKVIYKNPWITLNEDSVIRPDGKESTYSVIHLPRPVVVVIAVDEEGIYLIKNYRYPIGDFSIELPQGGVDDTLSSLLDSAKKELVEETGIVAKNWEDLGTRNVDPGLSDGTFNYFIATNLTNGQSKPEGNENISEVLKYSFSEIRKILLDGTITQIPTIAGLYLALDNLNKFQ